MFVIGVSGMKGGIGKSTIALNLAATFHRDGKGVLIVDADPQGTCRKWADAGRENERDGPPVVGVDAKMLGRDLARIARGFDFVVIDCPPRLGLETRVAMMASNVVLLPVIPGGADFWALEETIALVQEAQAARPALVAGVVMNRTDRTVLARDASLAIEKLDVPILDAHLGQRVTYGEATLGGLGVVDYARGSQAAREIRRLTRETLKLRAS